VDLARLLFTMHVHRDDAVAAAASFPDAYAFRSDPNLDAFALEYGLQFQRHLRIFARDQSWRHFHHRHAAAEAPVHLREFEPDITSAEDDEMLWQEVDVHHAGTRQVV